MKEPEATDHLSFIYFVENLASAGWQRR